MDPATGSIIAAGITGASGLLGGLFGSEGQEKANNAQMAFNSYQSQLNREWQEHMASTGYVRAMTDMRNAGLNPILAASLGPSMGGPGSAASATLGNAGAFMQQGMTNAGQAGEVYTRTKAGLTQAEKDSSQADLNEASKDLQRSLEMKAVQDTATSASDQRMKDAQADNYRAATQNALINNTILGHDVNTASAMSQIRQAEADQLKRYGPGHAGQIMGTIDKGSQTIIDDVTKFLRRFSRPGGALGAPPNAGSRSAEGHEQ